jgi:hypothetical protein
MLRVRSRLKADPQPNDNPLRYKPNPHLLKISRSEEEIAGA